MKRLNIYGPVLALVAFGGATAASAQSSAPIGIALRAGIFLPTDSNVSDNNGSTWFAFGAEYTLLHLDPKSSMRPNLSLSADYFSRNSLSEIPILLNYVVHFDQFFASAGAGVSFLHEPGNTDSKFGYQVGIGYNLPITSIPVFLEVKYWGTQDTSANGFGLYAGVRF